MKTKVVSVLRAPVLFAAWLLVPAFVSAQSNEAKDQPKQLLAQRGTVLVAGAGPYVEIGTFQIQVVAKLGQPAVKLADGAWLYPHFHVENSEAAGTLLVRFDQGRVSWLALVTPDVALALQKNANQVRVAERK